MLGLPDVKVTDFKQNDNDKGFYVETEECPNIWHTFGIYYPQLVTYKIREQKFLIVKRSALKIPLTISQ